MNTTNLDYKKIANQVKRIHKIAQQESWVPYYDSNLDELYLTSDIVDKKYSLYDIGDEIAVYIDKDSNIGGVFIQYFSNNLASHDEKYMPFKSIVLKKKKITKEVETLLLNTVEASLLEALTQNSQVNTYIPIETK